jgi:hypothetical protein
VRRDSLACRRGTRTIISIALPIVIIALVLRSLPGFHLDDLVRLILAANPLLLLAGFAIYYLGFPLRGYRWAFLLRRTDLSIRVRDATEIVFISGWSTARAGKRRRLSRRAQLWLARAGPSDRLHRARLRPRHRHPGLAAGLELPGPAPAVQFILGLVSSWSSRFARGLHAGTGRRLIAQRCPIA